LPVRIHGMLTCYDPERVMFVQDETGGIFVYYTRERLPLRAGQYVQVTGLARSGRHSHIIDSPVIEVVPAGPPVHPQAISLSQVYVCALDAQWVEVTGVVRTLKVTDSRLQLELAEPPYRIDVWVPVFQGYQQLPLSGSLVRVRGVVGASVNDRRELEGFQIFANTLSDITILRSNRADPFSTQPRLVGDLRTHYDRNDAPGWVRVQGRVTLCRPGRAFFIQDVTGGLEVQTQASAEDLKPGTAIDVAGYLGPALRSLRVEDAVFRKLGTTVPPQPTGATTEELFDGRYPNQLVTLEATLLSRANSPSNCVTLALEDGGRYLTAFLDRLRWERPQAELEPGSRLRVTGVCQVGADSDPGPVITLLLRSPADIQVVGLPKATRMPWLQVLAVGTVLVIAGFAAAFWAIRKQRRQTEAALQRQAALQADMRQGELQLRRSMEERERIGRDLHDDIIQSIYAVGLSLDDCRRIVRRSPEQAETRLATAIHTLNDTIRGVRGFIAGLEPKILNGREFKTALKSLVLTSGDGPTPIHIEVDPSAAGSLTSTQATQLLHIAKEAISNSLRHSQASHIMVSLHPVTTGVRLEVQDDGIGFNPDTVSGKGQGLRNIVSRARDLGADSEIVSAPGQGCRMLVTVTSRKA
jgi:signal transduction histidine kinase